MLYTSMKFLEFVVTSFHGPSLVEDWDENTTSKMHVNTGLFWGLYFDFYDETYVV